MSIRYKYFKVSINFFYLRIYSNTKVYSIKNALTHVLLAFWYSLISLLLGWWGGNIRKPFRGIRNTLEALHINLTGGIDYTKVIDETNYDEKTNYIWNNLLQKTTEKINKKEVELVIDIQDEFELLNKESYTLENIDYINLNLRKLNIDGLSNAILEDIFDAMKLTESRSE